MTLPPADGLYAQKMPAYFSAARTDVLALLQDRRGLRVLEIGAASGGTLAVAKATGLAAYCVGLDLVEPEVVPPGVDRFALGNFETIDVRLLGGPFDAILCADVLEHLVDPWAATKKLAGLLAANGCIVASLPNSRNFRLLRPVIAGDFRYEEAGLLDRSHLRFFCRKNVVELFAQANLDVETTKENMGAYGKWHRAFDRMTLGMFHDFFVFQFLVVARASLPRRP